MPTHRPTRIAEMIHAEVAQRLREDVKDPELTPISITRVEIPRDLGKATVWFLPLGGGAVTRSLQDALNRAARQIRGGIGRALRLRTAPELVFREDLDHERAVGVSVMLERIGRELRASEPAVAFDGEAGEE
jgi:ribosome-binding factor A